MTIEPATEPAEPGYRIEWTEELEPSLSSGSISGDLAASLEWALDVDWPEANPERSTWECSLWVNGFMSGAMHISEVSSSRLVGALDLTRDPRSPFALHFIRDGQQGWRWKLAFRDDSKAGGEFEGSLATAVCIVVSGAEAFGSSVDRTSALVVPLQTLCEVAPVMGANAGELDALRRLIRACDSAFIRPTIIDIHPHEVDF